MSVDLLTESTPPGKIASTNFPCASRLLSGVAHDNIRGAEYFE
jgi:hypothetical protein